MKAKTVKTASKRITNVTKTGKLMRRKLSGQHLTTGKSKRTLRNSTKKMALTHADYRKIAKMLPNG
ncbi:TPA: 50S ribosomal protein L35 [Candidatus Berkelbacteria bacterium]|uniref:50S ribosomal protein L35 n=1 Tax=Berkelbacteria bacterium GW2011_GWE1_39_12 TaxID=1618337 RepID=A0A0G4B415_9BACT|nr:MAG: 50S ribosomal protein L35 [Berkelbacteria bacterium GW2011_GWE1_39_12]HBO60308.1 50S ribosomal protein L35 [Candidatus Berkelbacteria bacterium]